MTHSSEGVVGKVGILIGTAICPPRILKTDTPCEAHLRQGKKIAKTLLSAGLLSGSKVRLPKRLWHPKRTTEKLWAEEISWNACLDEVKRLNRSALSSKRRQRKDGK